MIEIVSVREKQGDDAVPEAVAGIDHVEFVVTDCGGGVAVDFQPTTNEARRRPFILSPAASRELAANLIDSARAVEARAALTRPLDN